MEDPSVLDKICTGWDQIEQDTGAIAYVNHNRQETQWDHPLFTKVWEELDELNCIRYAAYRSALKLRKIQEKFGFDEVKLPFINAVMEQWGLPIGGDRNVDIQCIGVAGGDRDVVLQLSDLSALISDLMQIVRQNSAVDIPAELCAALITNWMLVMFDSDRQRGIQLLTVKICLASLSSSGLGEKFNYFFHELKDENNYVSRRKQAQFLQIMLRMVDVMHEGSAFGGNQITPAVESCFALAQGASGICLDVFISWLSREPQTLVWLTTLYRLRAAEHVIHQQRCSICRQQPIAGLCYKCLRCPGMTLCQDCFLTGKVRKKHKLNHPTQEYCKPTKTKDNAKAILKSLRNTLLRRGSSSVRPKMRFLAINQAPLEEDLYSYDLRLRPRPDRPSAAPLAKAERFSVLNASVDLSHANQPDVDADEWMQQDVTLVPTEEPPQISDDEESHASSDRSGVYDRLRNADQFFYTGSQDVVNDAGSEAGSDGSVDSDAITDWQRVYDQRETDILDSYIESQAHVQQHVQPGSSKGSDPAVDESPLESHVSTQQSRGEPVEPETTSLVSGAPPAYTPPPPLYTPPPPFDFRDATDHSVHTNGIGYDSCDVQAALDVLDAENRMLLDEIERARSSSPSCSCSNYSGSTVSDHVTRSFRVRRAGSSGDSGVGEEAAARHEILNEYSRNLENHLSRIRIKERTLAQTTPVPQRFGAQQPYFYTSPVPGARSELLTAAASSAAYKPQSSRPISQVSNDEFGDLSSINHLDSFNTFDAQSFNHRPLQPTGDGSSAAFYYSTPAVVQRHQPLADYSQSFLTSPLNDVTLLPVPQQVRDMMNKLKGSYPAGTDYSVADKTRHEVDVAFEAAEKFAHAMEAQI